jgi:hypothetical protein
MHSKWKVGVLLSMSIVAGLAGAQAITLSTAVAPVAGFVDISTTCTALASGDDNVIPITTTIGNALFPAGPVLISNNGMMVAGVMSGGIDFTNSSLFGSPPFPQNLDVPQLGTAYLMPFWDDLQPLSGAENTTVYWQELGGVLYVMWKNEGHFPRVPGQTVTFEVQVFQNPPSCGPGIQYLYVDTVFGGTQASADHGASATIGYVGADALNFTTLQLSFNSATVNDGSTVSISQAAHNLSATSPLGPGSLVLTYSSSACLAPLSSWALAATLHQGTFPSGWLYGVDIPLPELLFELSAGPPFTGNGGSFVLGPFTGLPPVTIYAVVLGFDGAGTLSGHTHALGYTIPGGP